MAGEFEAKIIQDFTRASVGRSNEVALLARRASFGKQRSIERAS